MGYASESKNKGWGLPIGLLALILMIALIGTAGAPTSAFAANIGCGQCHGTLDSGTNAGTSNTTDRRGVSEPGFEKSTMPTQDNGIRGLHGIHMNYSSATYGGAGTQTVGGTVYTIRGNCSYCHTGGNDHARHATGFVNFTSSGANKTIKATQPLSSDKYLMIYTSAGRGVSYKNNIPSLVVNPTGNCTKACHKGTSSANPAPWGNYTSSSVRLSCNACHDDVSNGGTNLSGVHGAHLGSAAVISGGTPMNSSANAGCANCHSNNVGEGSAANDNGAKAYPHASDGTNVLSVNADLQNMIAGTIPNADPAQVTCTAACHPRSSEISPVITWGSSMNCNMCHYYPGTGNTNTGSGALPGAHELHITGGGLSCDQCHDIPSDLTHVTNMPPSSTGVTFVAGLGNTGSGMNVTCQNSCHSAMSSSWNTTTAVTGCATCHYYPGATAGLGGNWLSGNGHNVRHDAPVVNTHMKATGFNYQTDTFSAVVSDNGKCGLCHRNTKHINGSGFAHLSSATGSSYSQCGTAPFTFTTGGVGNASTACSNVKCHSGKTTPAWR